MASKLEETRPRRKWSEHEVTLILDYLIENKNFEMPTAQSYYRKLIEEQKISPSWNLIRWKVRYLKKCYLKTKQWRYSKEGIQMEKTEGLFGVRDRMIKICPFYSKLQQIFGEEFEANKAKFNQFKFSYVDIDTSQSMDEDVKFAVINENSNNADTMEMPGNLFEEIELKKYEQQQQNPPQQIEERQEEPTDVQEEELPMITEADFLMDNNDAFIEHLTTMQHQLMKSDREILKFKQKKLRIFKKVEKQKIRLEKRKLKIALEWQNKLFELRKAELESKEKLARLELELKYGVKES